MIGAETTPEAPKEHTLVSKNIFDEDLFNELFTSDRLPVPFKELDGEEFDQSKDRIVLLVPPKIERELFEQVSSMIANLQRLHGIANNDKGQEGQLRSEYVKVKDIRDLENVGKQFGVELTASDDVPIMIVQNKYLPKPKVITLIDLLEDENSFYSSFRPLKEVTSQNLDRFRRLLDRLEEDQTILFQYGSPEEETTTLLRSSFYTKTLHPKLSSASTVESMFIQTSDWLSPADASTLKTGGIYILQRHGSKVLDDVDTIHIEGLPGKYLLYEIGQESSSSSIRVSDMLQTAGEAYYQRNLSVNRHLMPSRSQTIIDFAYDCNKLSAVQQSMAIDTLKAVRQTIDKADSHDVVRLMVRKKSFKESEGKSVALTLKEVAKSDKRIEYMFSNQSKEVMKKMLQESPEVASNNSFEVQYPDDFGFTVEHIKKFIELALAGQIPDVIQSELEPKYERYSRKLCGNSFVERVKNNPVSQSVFLYSNSCSSCKKFTPMYERLAKENIEKGFKLTGTSLIMNRMNKDHNDILNDKNYDSTPVFMMYRGDIKSRPYIYRQPHLTESSMRDFLSLTTQFNLLTDDKLRAAVSRGAHKVDLSSLINNTN